MEALASGRPPALQQLPGSSISADAVAEGGGGSGGVAAAADAEDGFVSGPEAAGALVEDSESLGRQGRSARERRLSTGSVSLGRPAGARPPRTGVRVQLLAGVAARPAAVHGLA